MENKIEVFQNEQFGAVRITLIDGEPWFAASDVCKALEIKNATQALSRLEEDERFTTIISNDSAASGKSKLSFVNEAGLYSLILSSRKPEAKAFKRWVTHEVIPAIRKTGGYLSEPLLQRIQNDPAVIFEFADALLAERRRATAFPTPRTVIVLIIFCAHPFLHCSPRQCAFSNRHPEVRCNEQRR